MQRDRWSWRTRAQGGAADTVSTRSACCMVGVKEDLRGIASKRVRCIGWLQRRALMRHSSSWDTCTTMALALLMTKLKRGGCTGLLPPKDILGHCTWSLAVTGAVAVLLQTLRKPFAGTGAPKQRVTVTLQPICGCWACEFTQ